jgi:uncharacterized protein
MIVTASRRRYPRRWMVVTTIAMLVAAGAGGWLYRSSQHPGYPSGTLRLSSGSVGGVYNGFAADLARQLHTRDHRLDVRVQPSSGSILNLQRLIVGSTDCAISAADAAALAVTGTAPFTEPAPIEAVARVYDDYIQLVATDASGIKSVADLTGKRVSVGSAGSGVQLIANRILKLSALGRSSMTALPLDLVDSVAAMRSGTIDAFFWSGGLPSPSVAELLSSSKTKLVPLDDVAAEMATHYNGVYRSATIPTGPYRLTSPIATLAVPNFIVCRSTVPASDTWFLIDTLFSSQRRIAVEVPAVNGMDQRSAIATDPVQLHPGAVHWFRHQKN